ncbi:MAG: Bug family tripartite tricarboxylate transporter substrate binding protein [Burkholderiales bacterium]
MSVKGGYERGRLTEFCITALTLGVVTLTFSPWVAAQSYPVKTVRFIVPSTAGASMDFSARLFANRVSVLWKQPVVVENRPGANFIVGTEFVTKAAPDGYTLLFATLGGPALNPAVFADLPYKANDLIPVVQTSKNTVLLYVSNTVKLASVKEFIALLKANPGKYNHASGGTSTFMLGHLLRSLAGVEFVDVNYKGGQPAFASLLTGETHFSFGDTNTAAPAVQAGKIRALALASKERTPLVPGMPTMIESGVPNFIFTSGLGIFAPANTPMEIVRKINADVQPITRQRDVIDALEKTGSEAETGSTEEFSRLVRSEIELWSKLVKERNIKVVE